MKPDVNTIWARKAARMMIISEYYLAGASIEEIASKLKSNSRIVRKYLGQMEKEWQDRYLQNYNALKMRELAKIDTLEAIYYDAWERSKSPAQLRRLTSKGNGEDIIIEEERNQTGDPRFLEGIMKCVEKRIELLGLKAPIKITPTNLAGDAPYREYTDEEIARRILALIAGGDEAEAPGQVLEGSGVPE